MPNRNTTSKRPIFTSSPSSLNGHAPLSPPPKRPLLLGLLGAILLPELDRLIEGNTTGARRIEVRNFSANDSEALRECQMIFVSASEQRRLSTILAAVQGKPVLVVGESEGFVSAGGMLGFALRENRVGIEVNSAAARQARLKISSQLLNIAKIVN